MRNAPTGELPSHRHLNGISFRDMRNIVACLAWWVVIFLTACAGNGRVPGSYKSGSRITPGYFRFATIIPDDGSRSGWRAVCIKALMGQGLPNQPYASARVCRFEVGTPLRNYKGPVSLPAAQNAATAAANDAAYSVLQRSAGVDETTCIRFRTEMNRRLKSLIPGAEVSTCGASIGPVSVPEVTWP